MQKLQYFYVRELPEAWQLLRGGKKKKKGFIKWKSGTMYISKCKLISENCLFQANQPIYQC